MFYSCLLVVLHLAKTSLYLDEQAGNTDGLSSIEFDLNTMQVDQTVSRTHHLTKIPTVLLRKLFLNF
jgi:hypothetical protein